MEKRTTKERILDAALESFAVNGYKGTNLRDLAAGLNLSKSALYKYYDSKEAIWDALLDTVEAYYSERFGSVDNMPKTPKDGDELCEMSMKMLDFTMHDHRIILTRQLLLSEQFHNDRARTLATLHFLTSTQEMYARIFSEMMSAGTMKKDDPEMVAFAYTTPISSLVQLCDREPEREPEILEKLEAFVKHFIRKYCE